MRRCRQISAGGLLLCAGWLALAGDLRLSPGWAPVVPAGEEARWEQATPWPAREGVEYELRALVTGAPFVKWRLTAVWALADGTTRELQVWPDAVDWRAPAPQEGWYRERVVAPTGAESVLWRVVVEAADGRGEPAMKELIWREIGEVVPLPEPVELLPNGGVEKPTLLELLAPAKGTELEELLADAPPVTRLPEGRVMGMPPGWPGDGWAVEEAAEAHGGKRFYRLRGTQRVMATLAVVDVTPPAVYRASWWVRGSGMCRARVRTYAAGYRRLPDVEGEARRAGREWTEVSVEVDVARGDPQVAYLQILIDATPNGDLDLDDASVRQTRGEHEQ